MGFTSETRSNYLRGGLTFGSAYDSDATTGSQWQADRGDELLDLADNCTRPDSVTTALGFDL